MPAITPNIETPIFICKDVIGVKGLCNKDYPYNLDSLGLSLKKTASLAGSEAISAQELIQTNVNLGWQQTFKDIHLDDFKLDGVSKTFNQQFTSQLATTLTHTVTITRNCEFEEHFYNTLEVSVKGTLSLVFWVVIDGIEQVLYTGDATDEKIIIQVNKEIQCTNFVINVVGTGTGAFYLTDEANAIYYNGYLKCSESLFFCKYWKELITAVQYKTFALILNNSLLSDRYNDFLAFKENAISTRIAQLDSTLNILKPDQRINQKGLYQLEIENISRRLKGIIASLPCLCCFECNTIIKSEISLP